MPDESTRNVESLRVQSNLGRYPSAGLAAAGALAFKFAVIRGTRSARSEHDDDLDVAFAT